MEMLKDFQARRKRCLEQNCESERQKLFEKLSIREEILDKAVRVLLFYFLNSLQMHTSFVYVCTT